VSWRANMAGRCPMHKTFGKKSNYQPEQLILIGRFFIKGQGNDTLATSPV